MLNFSVTNIVCYMVASYVATYTAMAGIYMVFTIYDATIYS